MLPLIFILCFISNDIYADPVRIVGGTSANISQFSYQVSLRLSGTHICGGSLITQKHVLTAGHCIQNIVYPPYEKFTVVTGATNIKSGGETHRVLEAKVHPDYRPTIAQSFENDVAVITLSEELIENENRKSIPMTISDPPISSELNFTGWGRVSTNGPLSEDLQKMTVYLLSNEKCQEIISMYPIHSGQLCTIVGEGVGACNGDSGGPLVYKGKLVGIASWVFKCAKGMPDVFTRVSEYRDFIYEAISNRVDYN